MVKLVERGAAVILLKRDGCRSFVRLKLFSGGKIGMIQTVLRGGMFKAGLYGNHGAP
jgi:hypothetical protein